MMKYISTNLDLQAEFGDPELFNDSASAIDAITKRMAEYNKSKRVDMQQVRAERVKALKELRAQIETAADPNAAAQELKDSIKKSQRDAKMRQAREAQKQVQQRIDELKAKAPLLAPGGIVARGTLDQLVADTGMSEDEVLKALNARVGNGNSQGGGASGVEPLSEAVMSLIQSHLDYLKMLDLYEFLGVSWNAAPPLIRSSIDKINKNVSETLDKTSAKVRSTTVLVQQCNGIFKDDASHKSYDKALYDGRFKPVGDLIAQILAGSKVMDDERYKLLLGECQKAKLPKPEAETRIRSAWAKGGGEFIAMQQPMRPGPNGQPLQPLRDPVRNGQPRPPYGPGPNGQPRPPYPGPNGQPRPPYGPGPNGQPRPMYGPGPNSQPRPGYGPGPNSQPRPGYGPGPNSQPRPGYGPGPNSQPRPGYGPGPNSQSSQAPMFPPEITFQANYVLGTISQGGKLCIYPDVFVFKPHSFNFGDTSNKVFKIADIVDIEKGVLTTMTIKMRSQPPVELAVWKKDTIINELLARRKALIGH